MMKKNPKKKKGKEKVNAAEAVASSDDEKDSIAFANSESAALIKDGTGATVAQKTVPMF